MDGIERLEQLFHDALALPENERRAWLAAQSGPSDMLHEVLGLLDSHAAISQGQAAEPAAQPSVPTAQFGAYRAVALIGRGGMSAVYRARRADGQFEQTVALKIMAGYLAGPDFLRRFDSERRLLAALSHNHITRLLDGGVSSAGDPYLITEYVEGQSIDWYCDDRALDIPGRLRIFLQVASAVAYAHGQSIVHRDVKPANILVDTSGIAKLLDFGTAQLTAQGTATVTGARMLTPRYASPEQLRGQPLDGATDIYSLGVVLYELLTGAWPFGDPTSTLSELSRAVGDTPVSAPANVVTAEAAQLRSATVPGLRSTLRGDLTAILARALEEDPARRYASVAEFAGDVRCYLEQRPVLARPQTRRYRVRKFCRRHRVGVSAAALLLLLMAVSSAFVYQVRAGRTEKARQLTGLNQIVAQNEAMIAGHMQNGQLELARTEAQTLRDSLQQVERDNPENAAISQLLAGSYNQLGEIGWFRYGPSLMDPEFALDAYTRAVALYEKADRGHVPFAFDSALGTRMFRSEILVEDGRGYDSFREVVRLLRDDEARLATPGQRNFGVSANLAGYYDMLSDRLGGTGWPARAGAPAWYAGLAALESNRMTDAIALQLYEASVPRQAGEDEAQYARNDRSPVWIQLGRLQHRAGRREEGGKSLEAALRGYSRLQGGQYEPGALDHLASVHVVMSRAAEDQGEFDEALRERSQALDILLKRLAEQPQSLYWRERVASSRIISAKLLERTGRHAEALAMGREGLRFLEENAGRARVAAFTLDSAAQRLLKMEPVELRDPARALEYARRAVEQTAGHMPPYLLTLAFAEAAAGHDEEARRTAARAVEGYIQVAEILRPLLETKRYPKAAAMYAEWQRELQKIAGLL